MVADLLLQLTDQADHIDLALNQLSGVGLVQMHLEEGLGTGQRLIAQAHRQVPGEFRPASGRCTGSGLSGPARS